MADDTEKKGLDALKEMVPEYTVALVKVNGKERLVVLGDAPAVGASDLDIDTAGKAHVALAAAEFKDKKDGRKEELVKVGESTFNMTFLDSAEPHYQAALDEAKKRVEGKQIPEFTISKTPVMVGDNKGSKFSAEQYELTKPGDVITSKVKKTPLEQLTELTAKDIKDWDFKKAEKLIDQAKKEAEGIIEANPAYGMLDTNLFKMRQHTWNQAVSDRVFEKTDPLSLKVKNLSEFAINKYGDLRDKTHSIGVVALKTFANDAHPEKWDVKDRDALSEAFYKLKYTDRLTAEDRKEIAPLVKAVYQKLGGDHGHKFDNTYYVVEGYNNALDRPQRSQEKAAETTAPKREASATAKTWEIHPTQAGFSALENPDVALRMISVGGGKVKLVPTYETKAQLEAHHHGAQSAAMDFQVNGKLQRVFVPLAPQPGADGVKYGNGFVRLMDYDGAHDKEFGAAMAERYKSGSAQLTFPHFSIVDRGHNNRELTYEAYSNKSSVTVAAEAFTQPNYYAQRAKPINLEVTPEQLRMVQDEVYQQRQESLARAHQQAKLNISGSALKYSPDIQTDVAYTSRKAYEEKQRNSLAKVVPNNTATSMDGNRVAVVDVNTEQGMALRQNPGMMQPGAPSIAYGGASAGGAMFAQSGGAQGGDIYLGPNDYKVLISAAPKYKMVSATNPALGDANIPGTKVAVEIPGSMQYRVEVFSDTGSTHYDIPIGTPIALHGPQEGPSAIKQKALQQVYGSPTRPNEIIKQDIEVVVRTSNPNTASNV